MTPENMATLSENEIRPDHLKNDQRAMLLADIAYLHQFMDDFVLVPCPACGKDRPIKAFEKYKMQYHHCDECGTLYISPRPQPQHLADFYANSQNYDYWNQHVFPASEAVRREKIFRPRAQRVKDICDKLSVVPNTMVEVGAGFGTFCEEVRSMGFVENLVAVEPSRSLAQTCRDRGLNVVQRTIENAEFAPGSVDVVCSFEVIEHLFDPSSFIAQCGAILRSGGLAIFTNPSGCGFDVVAAPQFSDTVDVEHLNYFTPDSMRVLFERHGFDVVEVLTPGKLDAELVHKMFLSGQLTREDNPFLYQILVERWGDMQNTFQDFLVQNKLSSHMWTIACKRA